MIVHGVSHVRLRMACTTRMARKTPRVSRSPSGTKYCSTAGVEDNVQCMCSGFRRLPMKNTKRKSRNCATVMRVFFIRCTFGLDSPVPSYLLLQARFEDLVAMLELPLFPGSLARIEERGALGRGFLGAERVSLACSIHCGEAVRRSPEAGSRQKAVLERGA